MASQDQVPAPRPNVVVFAISAVLLTAAWSSPATAQNPAAPPVSTAIAPGVRLAEEFMRAALATAAATPLTTHALDIACTLALEAVGLDPDSIGLWRLTLNLATLAERDELRAQAIDRLGRLDPADEGVRLQRLNMALERYATVDQRAEAYERLLADDNIERLGKPAASRLALDFALLKQRMGDTDAFSRWLTKSLELDRSNRSAAALAAGFFQANVNDPVGRAEMLVNLVMADPTDVQTQATLAQLLLDNGAYAAATRVYELARQGLTASRAQTSTEFMADFAIAQWAAGDIEGSLTTIDRRQADIDEAYRGERARSDRTLTMVQISALKGPIDPTLAAVTAVIHSGRRDPLAKASLDAAVAAAEAEIKSVAESTPPADAAELASRRLHLAWLALWLGDDAARAAEQVAEAEKLQPLGEQTRRRFEGWQALKAGESARSIEILTPLAAEDSAARVGLAIALEANGRAKDAARELLELNRAQPGSLIGIWASEQLARILGQRVPLSTQAIELERIITSIPRAFDRYARDGSVAVELRVIPQNPNPGAFDPILITVQLTNTTSMPLAVDRDGPLRPQVVVMPLLSTALSLSGENKPFVIDLDSRLCLQPHETTSTTFDLRWYNVGTALNAIATVGGIVKLTFDSNFVATNEGTVVPALYGVEKQAPLLRLSGVRKDPQWLEGARAMLDDPAADPESLMRNIALLAGELTLLTTAGALPPEKHDLLQQAKTALPAAFARLDPTRQAWVLAVMVNPAPVATVLDMARKGESRLVRLAYLLRHLTGPEDPMLDAARRGDDPALRQLAESLVAQAAAEKKEPAPAGRPAPPTTRPAVAPTSSPPATAPTTAPASTSATSPQVP